MTEDKTSEPAVPGREIADLLPFYATGRLGEDDRRRVVNALAGEPALRQELELIVEERNAAIESNEALGHPSSQAAARFFAALEATPAPRARRFDPAGWLEARFDYFRPRTLAWGAMAAALVVTLQAGLIGTLVGGHHDTAPGYAPASINPGAGILSGGSVIIAFVPSATAQDINKLLDDNAASIVAGPLPGGLYELRIGDHSLTKAEAGEFIARLREQRSLVRFVAPAAPPD